MQGLSRGQLLLSSLWAAFLLAGVLEMIVFAHVDPEMLHWASGGAIDLDPRAVYTLAFFVFWAVIAAACGLTLVLCSHADEINRRSTAGARQP